MKVNDDSSAITNQYDALDRLSNRLDGLGQTRYSYAVLGNGQRTFTATAGAPACGSPSPAAPSP